MSRNHLLVFAALLVGASSFGCAAHPDTYPLVSQPLSVRMAPDVRTVAYMAADAMLNSVQGKLRARETILPASFVNEGDLTQSSAMGRLLARQMASRFTQAGHSVVEVQLRKNLLLQKRGGQFLLSRELKKIRETHKVYAVLVGSYVVAKHEMFVTSQLVRLKDGVVLAAEDFSLPLDKDIRALLGQPQR